MKKRIALLSGIISMLAIISLASPVYAGRNCPAGQPPETQMCMIENATHNDPDQQPFLCTGQAGDPGVYCIYYPL